MGTVEETESRKSQPGSKMNQESFDLMEEWIESGNAEKAGFKGKSRIVSEAVREFVLKYTVPRFEHFNFAENVIRLIDNEKPAGTPYIEIALKSSLLFCRSCESKNCIHIEEAWNHTEIRKQLKRKNLKKLV